MVRKLLNILPHDTICREGGVPYMTRYYLLGGPRRGSKFPFNIYLHCFHNSDEPVPHNHPWNRAYSLILRGRYLEFRPDTRMAWNSWMNLPRVKQFRPGMINTLRANDFHWVELETDEVWTLFITFRRVQSWGFLTPKGFVGFKEYIKTKPGSNTTRQ